MYKAPHLRTQTTRRPHDGLQATGQPEAGHRPGPPPFSVRAAPRLPRRRESPRSRRQDCSGCDFDSSMIVVRLCPGSHLNFFEVVFLQKLRLTAPLVVRSSRPAPLRMMCCAVP
ncbi:hypothetical protein BDA96_02G073700 [Sorghum bicolor]|uniref:Uncharacterized protein n=1 Tax=Sorghum bicolor TaxID=4558 RepID=A0A921URY9_SORBI|nr:hypothetical protein BDA96_02G073700 [Sorghum bicolor]